MRASVVIPWHRNLDDLRKAVDSVLAQDEADFEIIVVANGVTEDEFAGAKAVSADKRYRVERLDVPQASAARNQGMDLAKGKLIFFLDADDTFLPGKITAFHAAQKTTKFDVGFSRGERVRGNGVSWPIPAKEWKAPAPIADFFFCVGSNISASALVVSSKAKTLIRFNDAASPYEDPDLLIQAEALGLKIEMLPATLYRWSDDRVGDRLSQTLNVEQRIAWIESTPANVSKRARAAFKARCVAQHLFPRRPLFSFGLLLDGMLFDGVSTPELVLFAVRGLLPRAFARRMVNRYLSRKSAVPS
jgi:glycosyltransferase involved in cell wall biosynthesis